jgi:hypothetical protein
MHSWHGAKLVKHTDNSPALIVIWPALRILDSGGDGFCVLWSVLFAFMPNNLQSYFQVFVVPT